MKRHIDPDNKALFFFLSLEKISVRYRLEFWILVGVATDRRGDGLEMERGRWGKRVAEGRSLMTRREQ
jgi:hypothetical protein